MTEYNNDEIIFLGMCLHSLTFWGLTIIFGNLDRIFRVLHMGGIL
jgi:hypothetical protein